MSKFKVCDKVTPINMDRSDDLRLVSKAHSETVDPCLTQQSQAWSSVVKTLDEVMPSWTLHHETGKAAAVAAIKELARKAKKPKATPETKPLRRGDLVKYDGDICVVFSKGADREGDYRIASLTDKPDYFWANINELAKIGSIRKKIRRIKKEMEGMK